MGGLGHIGDSRMLKKSASSLKVKAEVKVEIKKVSSSLNLDLNLLHLLDDLFEHPARVRYYRNSYASAPFGLPRHSGDLHNGQRFR